MLAFDPWRNLQPEPFHMAWLGCHLVCCAFDKLAETRSLTVAEQLQLETLRDLRDALRQAQAMTADREVPASHVRHITELSRRAVAATRASGLALDAMFDAAGFPAAR